MKTHEGSMKAGVDLTPGFAGLRRPDEEENKSASTSGALVFLFAGTPDGPPEAALRPTPALVSVHSGSSCVLHEPSWLHGEARLFAVA